MNRTRKFLFCRICQMSLAEMPIKTAYCSQEHRTQWETQYKREYYRMNREKLQRKMMEWRIRNPEKWKEIKSKAQKKYKAKRRNMGRQSSSSPADSSSAV